MPTNPSTPTSNPTRFTVSQFKIQQCVRVDFAEIDDGLLASLREWPLPILVGEIVRLYDGDGNGCEGTVVRIDALIWTRPDFSTWLPEGGK